MVLCTSVSFSLHFVPSSDGEPPEIIDTAAAARVL
jgi:hypothetical protein